MLGIAALVLAASGDPPTLEPFRQFVGSCWVADFSPTMRDTHCFELMYGGAHLRDRHEVVESGKPVYAGETIYSIEGPAIAFSYYNSLGGVGRGTVTADKAKLHFVGSIRPSPGKDAQPIDSEWKLVDDDHYEVRSLVPSASTGANSVLRFSRRAD